MLDVLTMIDDLSLPLKMEFRDHSPQPQEADVLQLICDYPQLNICYTQGENLGFGAGHNAMMASEAFTYYLALNPDGIPHPEMLSSLLRFAKGKQGLFEARQFPEEHPKVHHPETGETEWCSGCALMIPYDTYQKTQGFDDSFFMYIEDVDLSWRVREAGMKCYTVQDALFFHDTFNPDRDETAIKAMMGRSYAILKQKHRHNKMANFKQRFSFADTRW
jgi:hypothetical protein